MYRCVCVDMQIIIAEVDYIFMFSRNLLIIRPYQMCERVYRKALVLFVDLILDSFPSVWSVCFDNLRFVVLILSSYRLVISESCYN